MTAENFNNHFDDRARWAANKDDLLGNSTLQLWEKVVPMVREARERYDPRLYEHFEFLYDEMTRRAAPVRPAFATGGTGVVGDY